MRKNLINVLIISGDTSLKESIHDKIRKTENLNFVDMEINLKDLVSSIGGNEPDVILFDYHTTNDPYESLSTLSTNFSKTALIVIHPHSEILDTNRLSASGAHDILGFPCRKNQLIKAIHRVVNIVTEDPSDADNKMHEKASITFTVFSPRGGVGTTTVAINLAIGLQKKFQKDVLLIDGKYLFGHVALFCNIHTGNSISDLISHVGALDNQLINQVVVGHTSGIFILPSPMSISQAQAMKPDDLYNTISRLQEEFPIIVIDSGNFLDENTVTHMDLSDKILMVMNPDIASIRDARQFMEISESLSYPKDKTLLLLNSFDKKADMQAEEIEKILKTPIFSKIPSDTKFVINCINEGIPVMTKNPRHPISKALAAISDSMGKFVNNSEG